ncbi:MAG: Antitoxin VapB [Pseudomonadota bacterium]|jgi:antitoxin VapB
MPAQSTLFKSNGLQAVRLAKEMAFPDSIKRVVIRKSGHSRIITPIDVLWEEFFACEPNPDFPAFEPLSEYEIREEF